MKISAHTDIQWLPSQLKCYSIPYIGREAKAIFIHGQLHMMVANNKATNDCN